MQTNDIVSKYFIAQYYQTLCNDYKSMSKFYASDCSLSFSIEKNITKSVIGSDKIVALFEECGLQESVINLDNGNMTYVATENGDMIILVSGQISLADEKEKQFSQVFNLVKLGEYYAIKSDMLHLMEIPLMFIEQEVEEEVVLESEEPQAEAPLTLPAFDTPVEEQPEPIEEPVEEPVEESQPEPVEESQPEPVEESQPEPVEEPAESVEEPTEVEPQPQPEPVEEPVEEPQPQPELVVEPSAVEPPAVEPPVEGKEEPAKKEKRPFRRPHRARPAKREEKDDDGFKTVKVNYTKKATTRGSSIFVKYDNKSINKEAILYLFKKEGTVVNVFTNDSKLFAFVDFSEKDAAEKVVEKAREEPFRLGNVTLSVQINKNKNERMNRTRATPKKE